MTTAHLIPDGPTPNDTITIVFGDWKGALDGNDSLRASVDSFTVKAAIREVPPHHSASAGSRCACGLASSG